MTETSRDAEGAESEADGRLRATVREALERRFREDGYSGVLTHFVVVYARQGYSGTQETSGTGFWISDVDMPPWMARGLMAEGLLLHDDLMRELTDDGE